jgi:large subunit ribosomal protein L4
MATLTIRDAKGADAGTLDVADNIFAIEPNKNAVRQSLIAYEANQRRGTHSTKTRAFVRGGGRKPFKQKGTGRARQGTTRAPHMRHGAIIFGPQPRDYDQKVNKKVKRLALYSALSDLRTNNAIVLVNGMDFTAPKTKEFAALLDRLGIVDARRILVLLPSHEENLLLSARNLPNVLVSQVENVNIFDLLTCDRLVTTPDGIKKLEEQIG